MGRRPGLSTPPIESSSIGSNATMDMTTGAAALGGSMLTNTSEDAGCASSPSGGAANTVVTVTTIGCGDIIPVTAAGKIFNDETDEAVPIVQKAKELVK